MINPWETISLPAYENHMRSKEVFQLQTLSNIMKEQFTYNTNSVTILGVAGGNGLEHIDLSRTDTICIIDINVRYLEECKVRFSSLSEILNPICCDLSNDTVTLPESNLLICNLIIEYIGLDTFRKLIERNMRRLCIVSCVIQKNDRSNFVSDSKSANELSCLNMFHQDIDKDTLIYSLSHCGMKVIHEMNYSLPGNKEFVRVDFRIK